MALAIIFALTPIFLSAGILVPLLITLYKLRSFHINYGMQMKQTKVVIHLSVCILLFLLYIFNFLYQQAL